MGMNKYSIRKRWFEKTWGKNVTIAHVLYANKEITHPAYVSKHNSNREKQVILLMMSNGKKREAKSEGRL